MFQLNNDLEHMSELRVSVVDSLIQLMNQNNKIIALDADLCSASMWNKIMKYHPNRLINMGISEANMVGVAAGLSQVGFIPFIHTFGPFATRRVFDQLFISGGYAKNTINIYGSDPGFTVGANGGTHTTWEDIALMRMIPKSVVCDAADTVQMSWIINEFSKLKGIHYVRGNRKNVHQIYEKGSTFEIGKGNILKKGKDILLIATGQLVYETLQVANHLEKQGYSCEVIDMFTIKPIDKEIIKTETANKRYVVTIENHSITGGLGSAVAEILAEENIHVPLKRIGVNEQFGQVGSPEYLQEYFGLTEDRIIETILQLNLNN